MTDRQTVRQINRHMDGQTDTMLVIVVNGKTKETNKCKSK